MRKVFPKKINLIVFDFDGVMTNNKVYVDENGKESVRCDRSDGLGIEMVRSAKIPMLVLSTEKNKVVAVRCKKLKLSYRQSLGQKKDIYLKNYLKKNKILDKNVVYVGNDINDLKCFGIVGFSVAVSDAYPEVIQKADLVLKKNGGNGAVRELCELILRSIKK